MSYSRSFTKRISIPYSGKVSKNVTFDIGGGNKVSRIIEMEYSGIAQEDVVVNVGVDTDPFDASVRHCNNTVGVLTGAVVATESAQVASVKNNAMKVGQTIINGFFKTVRSEISQQIVELTNQIKAILLHLDGLGKRCIEKQRQMETDYHRLSERYLKVFAELDNELKNRVFELDRPAFVFKQLSDKSAYRALGNDLVSTTAVSSLENSRLEAMISASVTKKHALDTIRKADVFLGRQASANELFRHCALNIGSEGGYYVPVCYLETRGKEDWYDKTVFRPDILKGQNEDALIEQLSQCDWDEKLTNEVKERIRLYFNTEVSSHYAASDLHKNRIKNCIAQLFNMDFTKTVEK